MSPVPFFQTWTGGRMPADASRNSLGGMIDGVLAEYALLQRPAPSTFPAHLSFEEAATLPCAALTAWNAVVETATHPGRRDDCHPRHRRRRLVFALAFAKMHGAYGLSHLEQRREAPRARTLGADH